MNDTNEEATLMCFLSFIDHVPLAEVKSDRRRVRYHRNMRLIFRRKFYTGSKTDCVNMHNTIVNMLKEKCKDRLGTLKSELQQARYEQLIQRENYLK